MIQWQIKLFKDLSPAELYAIMRLRQEVFVLEQHCAFVDADGKDEGSWHLSGFIDDHLAAYARIVFPGIIYDEVSIGRIVTSMKFRRTGTGRLLMKKALEETERIYGKVPIRIMAQEYLRKFYEDYGFVKDGDSFLEDGISHIIMVKD